ncbi:MAG: 5-oxoprolinase subunit PxpB [Dokdonella sp.]
MNTNFSIESLGEDALLLRLGNDLDDATNARVHRLAADLNARRPPWLLDIIPAYATLALCIDIAALESGDDPLKQARTWIAAQNLESDDRCPSAVNGRSHVIKVTYGGTDGPDLDAVATHAGLRIADVIAHHCAVEYRVAMLGFLPGFPYLMGLDEALTTPRHATPRLHVAAGSVGIAGAQTGIYPRSGPGGWQIIGRTDAVLFDSARDPPALLAPGDRVRFVAVDQPRGATA